MREDVRAANPLPEVLECNVPTDEKWSLSENAVESTKVLTRREAQERAKADGIQNFIVKFWKDYDEVLTKRETQEITIQMSHRRVLKVVRL